MIAKNKKRAIWLIATLYLLCSLIFFFDLNLLRHPLEQRLSAMSGRVVSIKGDLKVRLGWHPRIAVHDVSMSNAAWSTTPTMVSAQEAVVTVNFLSLFRKTISLPYIRLIKPLVILEVNPQGKANWQFDDSGKSRHNGNREVTVGELFIDSGQLVYRNAKDDSDLSVAIASSSSASSQGAQLSISATGKYHSLDTRAHGEVGAINSLEDLQNNLPLNLEGHIGKTALSARGTVQQLSKLQGLNLDFHLSGDSLAEVFPLIGVPLPATPAYDISGQVQRVGAKWHLPKFQGKVGNSDVHGEFSVDRTNLPQFIKASLQSSNLDMKDLSGFIGGRNDAGEKVEAPDHVLPTDPFSFEKLHAADAEVEFTGKHIITARVPIDDLHASLTIKGGHLTLQPLKFSIAGGNVQSTINLDSNVNPIATSVDARLHNVKLEQLLPRFNSEKINIGVISGRMQLAGQGDSVAAMLGTANGQTAFVMNSGSISKLLVRLSNLDVANSVLALLGGNKSVPIRCMVTDLQAKEGVMSVQTMVLDTDKATISGTGSINLKDESLDLQLKSQPKDISLVTLHGPIKLTGTFKHPNAAPEVKNLAGRVAIAAAAGAVTGLLAFIPLLEFGNGQDSDCAALLRDATRDAQTRTPSATKQMAFGIDMNDDFAAVSF